MKALLSTLLALTLLADDQKGGDKREAFLNVNKEIPSIRFEMRYATDDNFIGSPVDGYRAPLCYLTKEAALALQKVQTARHRSLTPRLQDRFMSYT